MSNDVDLLLHHPLVVVLRYRRHPIAIRRLYIGVNSIPSIEMKSAVRGRNFLIRNLDRTTIIFDFH